MTHILILGKNGQLGKHLTQLYSLDSAFQDVSVTAWSRDECDVSQLGALKDKLRLAAPDVIINASAYTNTQQAEKEQDIAKLINGEAPAIMASTAKELDALFVHVSTDYVFDGSRRKPYVETDNANPKSAYGNSKLIGEQNIMQAAESNAAIIRTSWLFSAYGSNFFKTMLMLSQTREEIDVIADQHGSPTFAGHLALVIAQLIQHYFSGKKVNGLYHYCDRPDCTWHDFATAIFHEARELGYEVKTNKINAISASDWTSEIERPDYSVLSSDKLSALLGITPYPWQSGVREALLALKNQFHQNR